MGSFIPQLFGTPAQQQTQFSRIPFTGEQRANIEAQQSALGQQTGQFQNLLGNLQNQALNVELGRPEVQFQQQLDPLSQQVVSQGQQQLLNQAAARQQQVARQFQNQPGIRQALARQQAAQVQLQQNPLLFQALQQQSQRELGQQQLSLAAQQAANQAILQEQQARQAAAQLGGAGLEAQRNLLQTLLGVGEGLQGRQTTTNIGKKAGLLEKTPLLGGALARSI